MNVPGATAMQQPPRPVSAFAAEQLWRCVCAVLSSGLELQDSTVADLQRHADDLRSRIPAGRLAAIDGERLARARG